MANFFSLLEAAAHFKSFEENMEFATEGILTEFAVTVRDRAKAAIGTYKYGWPQLAESTQEERARAGVPPNEPLLISGKLRDSISATVEMHGKESGVARVGSTEQLAVWQELGTSRIPPRSFLVSSAKRTEADLGKIARKYVHAAWTGAGHHNELLDFLHVLEIALDTAREVYHAANRELNKRR